MLTLTTQKRAGWGFTASFQLAIAVDQLMQKISESDDPALMMIYFR